MGEPAYDPFNPPMMKCGHAANSAMTIGEGDDMVKLPVCVICLNIKEGADVIDDDAPDLTGRMARCGYRSCGREPVPSSPGLAFFRHLPDREFDDYYCGCKGWD